MLKEICKKKKEKIETSAFAIDKLVRGFVTYFFERNLLFFC